MDCSASFTGTDVASEGFNGDPPTTTEFTRIKLAAQTAKKSLALKSLPPPDATIGVSHDEAIGSEREPTFAFKFDKLDHALVAEAESYPSSSETEI